MRSERNISILGVATGDYELDVPAQFGFEQYHLAVHLGTTPPATLRVRLLLAPVAQNLTVEPQAGEARLIRKRTATR